MSNETETKIILLATREDLDRINAALQFMYDGVDGKEEEHAANLRIIQELRADASEDKQRLLRHMWNKIKTFVQENYGQ